MADSPALTLVAPDLPPAVVQRRISEAQWRTLKESLYPGAADASVLLVWDYCAARNLDPMKRPCHIVPIRVKDARGQWDTRDVVMPGIYEHRTTAMRTKEYLGHSVPIYGPVVEIYGLAVPEWVEMTFYRWNDHAKCRTEFPVSVLFQEVVGLTRDGKPNERWARAPRQMMTKCCEAAGLRAAFPEEIGGEPTAEEMDTQLGIDEPPLITIAAAPRKSETPPPVVIPQGPPEPPPPDDEPHGTVQSPTVGTIKELTPKPGGAVVVLLSTGYKCGTKDPELIAALEQHKAKGTRVSLVTSTPRDPHFAPKLVEVTLA